MLLVIDFGIFNIIVGIYIDKEIFLGLNENLIESREYLDYEDDKVKFVKIINEIKKEMEIIFFILSIVGVKNIKDDEIEYIFGYDVMMEFRRRYVDDGMSFFYDIKRWISDFDKSEKVIDINEKIIFIKRKDIIKVYLNYIIFLV